jgi:hypothetical protein
MFVVAKLDMDTTVVVLLVFLLLLVIKLNGVSCKNASKNSVLISRWQVDIFGTFSFNH